MAKLEAIVARLPEAARVDIEAWGGEPTFRVNGKNFVFASPDATSLSVKLPKEEADAVVATDAHAEPTGYGLGRSGWISVSLPGRVSAARWREIEEDNALGNLRAAMQAVVDDGRLDAGLVDPFAHMLLAAVNELALLVARAEDTATAQRQAEVAVDELLTRLLPKRSGS